MHQSEAKQIAFNAGIVVKVSRHLDRDNEKFLAIAIDLVAITFRCSQGKREAKVCSSLLKTISKGNVQLQFLRCGGTAAAVRIMNTCNYEKLLYTTARLLKLLSGCSENKAALVTNGGMQALARHLTHESVRLINNCLLALRNLSDMAGQCPGMQQLLHQCHRLLGSGHAQLVGACTGIILNLTAGNSEHKVYLA